MSTAQEDPGRVFLHPGSVYSNEKEHVHLYLVYFEKALTSQLYIRDATFANPYSILVRLRAVVWAAHVTSLSYAELLACACMVIAAVWWRHHRAARARNNYSRRLDCLQCGGENCCACKINSYRARPLAAEEDRATRDRHYELSRHRSNCSITDSPLLAW
eukprot:COSAG02_NODE_1638_length_11542_cov_13.473739_3_plen_160_part_00